MTATMLVEGPPVVGVDVGGTKTSVVVLDAQDRILYQRIAPTDPSSVVTQIAGLVEEARREVGRDIAAVGVAMPGHVDPWDGSVRGAVNLGIGHLRLGPMLETELGIPVFVEHDARAAAYWVSRQAAIGIAETAGPGPGTAGWIAETAGPGPGTAVGPIGQGGASVAYLSIGTGISVGVVLDGTILRGDNGLAGEVGHLVADPDGIVCACGLRGCLETVAAGPAIGRQADEAIAGGGRSVLPPHASAAEVFRAADAGDEIAIGIVSRVADHLARAIRSLALTLGVQRIVIGGGVAAAGSSLLDPILSRIARDSASSPLARAALEGATVELLSPTEVPGARGAAANARHRAGLTEGEGVGER